MIDGKNNVFSLAKTSEQLSTLLEKIFAATRPDAVYSKPVVSGNYTVITASEITSSGGFGSGGGFELATSSSAKEQAGEEGSQPEQSGGNGFGGGGMSVGRPVAVIIIGPDGVTVKPIFDVTKIALAGISTWITLLAMFRKARKASKG